MTGPRPAATTIVRIPSQKATSGPESERKLFRQKPTEGTRGARFGLLAIVTPRYFDGHRRSGPTLYAPLDKVVPSTGDGLVPRQGTYRLHHGRTHVHILAGQVNAFGGVWRGSNDYRRAMVAVRHRAGPRSGQGRQSEPVHRRGRRPGATPGVTARPRQYSFPGQDHGVHPRLTAAESAELAAAAERAGG